MACQWYPKGKLNYCKSSATPHFMVGGAYVTKALLLKQGAALDIADEFVSDVIAGSLEISGGSYARQGITATVSLSGNYVVITSAAITFTALAAGDTVVAMVLYSDIGGGDSANPVIAWFDGGSYPNDLPKATTGGDLVVSPHAVDGWLKM